MKAKVGDLVKHESCGIGLVVGVSASALEINGRKYLYDVEWSEPAWNHTKTLYWGESIEAVNESR